MLQIKSSWRDGTTQIVMPPKEFMQRLAALDFFFGRRYRRASDQNRFPSQMPLRDFSRQPLPGGVFFARHTLGFAAGVLLVAIALAIEKQRPAGVDVLGDAILLSALSSGWALMAAGLFALGVAWGGMPRFPSLRWSFACGLLMQGGQAALIPLLESAYPPGPPLQPDFPPESNAILVAWLVLYSFMAPVLIGVAAALLLRYRTGRFQPGSSQGDASKNP